MPLITLEPPTINVEGLGFFRHGCVGDKVVLTNDAGDWHLLDEDDFRLFVSGGMHAEHPEYEALRDKCFLRAETDLNELAERVARKRAFISHGPHLHVVVTTLRCNQSCRYCHASRRPMKAVETDMSLEIAKGVVDHAMQSTSPVIAFEFQGGEPTVNMDVIRFVVDYATEKNRYEKKRLEFSLVTNFTRMDETIGAWLLDNEVYVCTSLDGPRELHDFNRPGERSFDEVVRWIRWFNERYVEDGRDPLLWHVDALATVTRKSFDHLDGILALYAELGIRNVHLRPLNPFGFARPAWERIGYSIEEYLAFYERALDRILELNREGIELMEGTAAVFLAKLLTPDDPNYVDIRSPCGAATGQVAYDHDGAIYPCDEARMLAAQGDTIFRIGGVGQSMEDTLAHPTVKALALASMLDSIPGCESCWNRPFCGVCPMHTYSNCGDIFGQRPRSSMCKRFYATASMLIERLAADADGSTEAIFRRWTVQRPREISGGT